MNHDVEDVLDNISCAMIEEVSCRTRDLVLIEQAKLCAESFCNKYMHKPDEILEIEIDVRLTAVSALKLRAEFLNVIKTDYIRSLPWYQRLLEHRQIRCDIKSFDAFINLVRNIEVSHERSKRSDDAYRWLT